MYGLWLFKEIKTEYGYCKVEIYRKGYDGSQIEIGALAANNLTISLENLSEITAPIGKSVCSFAIIDTDQVDYDAFFTPDATAYKVVVSSRVGNGAYITRWSGYVTPDFFAENLSYRTPISISARDNIGYLNDVDFDLVQSTITIRELITKAFARIASDYLMSLEFVSQKQTAEGILAIDATISTALLKEMSWYEALETVLHDLGLQMRWVDNNTIAVMDLSQIPEYYTTQEFNFIHSSGYREILPAWRQLSQSQDYGLRENFFEGWMRSDNLTFIKSVVIRPPNAINWTTDIACYAPNNWGVAREAFTIDPVYYGSKFNKKIYFSGVSADYPTTTYLSWRQPIQVSDKPMQITFKAFNSVIYPSEKYTNISTPSGRRLEVYNPMNAVHGQKVGEYLQLGLKMNVLLHSGLDTYVLKNNWELTTNDGGDWQLNFSLPKVDITYVEGGEASGTEPREEDVTINIGTIPYSGDLELRIYGYYVIDKHNYWEDDYSVTDYTFDWEKCVTYINEPVYSLNTEDAETGQNGGTIISELHNVARKEEYTFGEIPENSGGCNAYAGGIVDANGKEINGFQRNADGSNYNLLELVGREIIHFNKKNYNKLSGTIKNLDKEPLYFNKLFIREGKTYMPFSCSLNVISNEMNITTMQEVEPYTTESFTEINSEVVTGGGATVGGGNNTVLQYSEEAGNVKRVYELDTATETEKGDAYILIDNTSFPEAKKVHIKDIVGLDTTKLKEYLTEEQYLKLPDADKKYALLDFFTDGAAKNALLLNGYNSDYFATASGLATQIENFNYFVGTTYKAHLDEYSSFKTDTQLRLDALEALWAIDEENNGLYPKSGRGIWSESYITAGGINASAGAGGLIQTVYGYDSLGGTFDNTVLTDTFNAYTINQLHISGEAIKDRVEVLEANMGVINPDTLLSLNNYIAGNSARITSLEDWMNNPTAETAYFNELGVRDKLNVSGSATFDERITGVITEAVNLTGTPEIKITDNTIAVLVGEKTSAYITVPYAAKTLNDSNGNSIIDTYAKKADVNSLSSTLADHIARIISIEDTLICPSFGTLYVNELGVRDKVNIAGPTTFDSSVTADVFTGLATNAIADKDNNDITTTYALKKEIGAAIEKLAELNDGISSINDWMVNASIETLLTRELGVLDKLNVSGAATFDSSVAINGNTVVGSLTTGSLSVSGVSTFTGKTTHNGGIGATTGTFSSTLSAGDTTVASLISSGAISGGTATFGSTTVSSLTSNGNISATSSTILGYTGRFFEVTPRTDGSSGVYNLGSSDYRWTAYLKSADIAGDIRLKPTSANYGNYLYFGDGSYCYIAELTDDKMTIYSSGGLEITANTDVSGNIYATGEITAGTASDKRLKDNIQSMTDEQAISVLRSLRPVTFSWNSTAYELGKHSGYSDGFIADEYEALIPNSGRSIWSHYRAINYERAISYVVKGWQIHETRLERLERENRELRVEVEQLKQYRRA